MQVYCPSGLTFTARHWKLGDQAALLDTKEELSGGLPKKMVSLAAQDVINPGPYRLEAGKPIDWDIVSHSDIAVANIMIRAGRDPKMLIRPNCTNCRRIQKEAKEVDLLDLPVYEASQEGKDHLATGEPVQLVIGDASVKIKAIRGKDMITMAALQQQEEENMLEILNCLSIVEIKAPGQKGSLQNLPDIRAFWREQDWSFRDVIDDKVDELFGGVDMSYKFICDYLSCHAEQEQNVPLDLNFYGLDQAARRSKRAKASSVKSVRELMQRASSPSSAKSRERQGST